MITKRLREKSKWIPLPFTPAAAIRMYVMPQPPGKNDQAMAPGAHGEAAIFMGSFRRPMGGWKTSGRQF